MHVEFTHVSTPDQLAGHRALTSIPDSTEADLRVAALERAGFTRLVVDDAGGLLTNLELAARASLITTTLDVALTHWAGDIEPDAAARQLAALDELSDGRLSVRIMASARGGRKSAGHATHVETLQRLDEYLVLLKRLWANDQPFDHEGPAYSLTGALVREKGPRGAAIPFRMGGLSGTAFRVAGRHADVFELPYAEPTHIRHIIDRVKSVAAEYGRTTRIGFAMALRFEHFGEGEQGEAGNLESAIGSGSPEKIALALMPYLAVGVTEFMVCGLRSVEAITAFGTQVAPMIRNSAARLEEEVPPLRERPARTAAQALPRIVWPQSAGV